MGIVNRDQLLEALARGKRRYREIELPICGVTVRVRSLTEGELSRYQRRLLSKTGRGFDPVALEKGNRALFALCMVDEQGNRLFADYDITKLPEMDAADSSVLYAECCEHCGIDRADVGDLVKNSEPTSGNGSPSGLQTAAVTSM